MFYAKEMIDGLKINLITYDTTLVVLDKGPILHIQYMHMSLDWSLGPLYIIIVPLIIAPMAMVSKTH